MLKPIPFLFEVELVLDSNYQTIKSKVQRSTKVKIEIKELVFQRSSKKLRFLSLNSQHTTHTGIVSVALLLYCVKKNRMN